MSKPFSTRDFSAADHRTHGLDSVAKVVLHRGLSALGKMPHQHSWGADRVADFVSRGAVSPMDTVTGSLFARAAYEFLDALTPMSAAAALMGKGIELDIGSALSIIMPGVSIPSARFVAEGMAFPVVQEMSTAPQIIAGYKLGVITSVTTELFVNPGAEQAIRQVLIESVGPSLDQVLFDANPAVAQLRPAGILHNITPLTASSATGNEAMFEDLETIGAALSSVLGNGTACLVVHPKQATALAIRLPRELSWPVFASNQVPVGQVIGVASNAFVSASGIPGIDVSSQASVHMDDSAKELVSASPVTIAAPVRGTFQTSTIALKVKLPVTWAVRDSRGVVVISSVAW
jgi:hypothetical protein